jgi:hypothetical protein
VSGAIGSCNLTPYEAVVSASAARATATSAGLSVGLPGGVPSDMLEVQGSGGAPDVTVAGPDGVSGTGAGIHGSLVIQPDPRQNVTWVAILHPAGGRYTLTANPGSAPISSVLAAHGYTPRIRARVIGAGTTRQLHYAVNLQPGEKVSFLERGTGVDRLIGSARRSRGVLRFQSAPGPRGLRQIVALGSDGGRPLILAPRSGTPGQLVVASYRTAGPRRLAAVRGLTARRVGGKLRIHFRRVPGARSYAVLISMRSGLRTSLVAHGKAVTLAVPTAGAPGGSVTVTALGDQLHTSNGRARSVKVTVPPVRRARRHHRHH